MPGAGGAAEDAKFGAMRMVKVHGVASSRECSAEIELRVVRQQRAGDDGRLGCTLVLDHHSGCCAHDVRGRLAENAPARFSNLRDVDLGVHLREDHQRDRIIGVERHAKLGEQPGETATQLDFRLARQIAGSDV